MANQSQPLSSFNVFHEIQQDICDIMNASPVLSSSGIEFIAENRLDIDYQIKESLRKQGMAAVVMTPNAQYIGHNGTSEAYQLEDLTIQFVEYTPINRASNRLSVITGLDLANYTSELLGGPNAVIGFGKLCPKGIEQGEDSGLLVTKLTFSTYIENGDTGPIIYVPFVTKEEMEEYVGNGKLTFTKEGQQLGYFTANQKTDLSVEIPNSGVWGQITGEIDDQSDLAARLSPEYPSTDAGDTSLAGAKATAEFVNSSINAFAAFYLTKNANGDAFGTYAELSSATKFYNAGEERIPSKNDYLVVLEDETKTTALSVNPTTRYTYQGEWPDGQFEFQYIVNNTALTQAQVNAINSGITREIVDNRVIPSTSNPGYAKNADYALQASASEWASSAGYANNADYADNAGLANEANYAYQASNASLAETAQNAVNAATADAAIIATYAPDYTPLSTFNNTLGNLSSIIHGI